MARSVLTKGWRYHLNRGLLKHLLRLEEFQTTQPGVLLNMQAASVSHADLDKVRGYWGGSNLPAVAGSSGVGVVNEGSGTLKAGDRAVVAGCQGAWATKVVVGRGAFLAKVPASIPPEAAATFAEGPMAAYQILKANGLKSGDVVALDGKSTLLGSSVAELGKAWGIQVGSAEAVGTKGAKLALSLVGTSSFSALANSLVEGGTMLVAVPASADAHFLPSAALATKCIRVQGFSVSKALQGVGDPQVETMVQELSEMVAGGKFKNSFIKHEFANVLECVNDVSSEVSKGVHWLAIN